MPDSTTGATGTMIRREGRELFIERVFNAPRALVFSAFSKPEHLEHWWGPKGWTLPVCNLDFRPGGVWHYCMRGPAGEESWGRGVYREIVEPERIVYVDAFSDAEGNVVGEMPEALITLFFDEQDGKTRVTSKVEYPSEADVDKLLEMGMIEGLTETWDRLEDYLAKQQG